MERPTVHVLYFAAAREHLNLSQENYQITKVVTTLKDIFDQIRQKHKDNGSFIGVLETSMIAVNSEYVYELSK